VKKIREENMFSKIFFAVGFADDPKQTVMTKNIAHKTIFS
jgi:hypothetical protein